MAIVSNYPLNVNWAQETSNKISFNETEFGVGVTYKGPIVSNQLNGISFVLSQILQYSQVTDGYYSPTMKYHRGNFVKVVHTGLDHAQQMESYICINDNNGAGIINTPPITGTVSIATNGITLYSGGEVNNAYWKRVDVGGSAMITPEVISYPAKLQESDKFLYFCRLMTLPDLEVAPNSGMYKSIKSNLIISTVANRKRCLVELRIEGKYTKSLDGTTYNKPVDYFNMPVPDVYIDNVYFREDGSKEGDNYNPPYAPDSEQNSLFSGANQDEATFLASVISGEIAPYGFNIVVGYNTDALGKRSWGLYLGFPGMAQGYIEEISLHGESTIPVSISTQLSTANFTIMNIIPVRPNGGKNSYDRFFELIEYDQTVGRAPGSIDVLPMFWYSRGLFPLSGFNTAKDYITTYNDLGIGILWMLSRMQAKLGVNLVDHSGRYLRNLVDGYAGYQIGQILEPGLPNVTGWFYSTNQFWAGTFPNHDWLRRGGLPNPGDPLRTPAQIESGSCVYEHERLGVYWCNFWNKDATSTNGAVAQIIDASCSSEIYKGRRCTRNYTDHISEAASFDLVTNLFSGTPYEDVTTKSVTVRRYMKAY